MTVLPFALTVLIGCASAGARMDPQRDADGVGTGDARADATDAGAGTGTGGTVAGSGGRDGSGGNPGSGGSGGSTGSGGSSGNPGSGGSAGSTGAGGAASGGAGGGATLYSPCPPTGTACKILPFGDSITFGVGSNGSASNGGYRVELFHRALEVSKQITFVGTAVPNGPATVDGVAFPGQHEGHSGFTIDDQPATATLAARQGISPLVATVMPATRPDIVTLMIGTNDIQHDYDVANAPVRLGRVIDSLIAADAHTLVIVAQIIPTTDATLNPAVQAYNAAIPALVAARATAGKHILLVDLYDAIANDPSFMTSGRVVPSPTAGPMFDWLHPNVAGYKLIGDAWFEVLKGVLH
jgi:lysophospholipase L1-like esterase